MKKLIIWLDAILKNNKFIIAFLLFFMLTKVLVSVYYSQKYIKSPVKYAVLCVSVNILLNIIWVRYFAHVGIALASSVAALLNVLLLWRDEG